MRLQEGLDLGDALHLLPSKTQRMAAVDALTHLTAARDVFAQILVTAALSSGIPVEELARRLEESPEEVLADRLSGPATGWDLSLKWR